MPRAQVQTKWMCYLQKPRNHAEKRPERGECPLAAPVEPHPAPYARIPGVVNPHQRRCQSQIKEKGSYTSRPIYGLKAGLNHPNGGAGGIGTQHGGTCTPQTELKPRGPQYRLRSQYGAPCPLAGASRLYAHTRLYTGGMGLHVRLVHSYVICLTYH